MLNYFEIYEIPESFNTDEKLVKKRFYELSKKYHPDFYINEPKEKQDQILELSTLNNQAYKVLTDRRKRIEYILKLHNLIDEGEKYQLPQSFLVEMMDVNEALMELEFNADAAAVEMLRTQVDQVEDGLINSLNKLMARFDSAQDDSKKSILLEIKELWYRQKYLLRIRDSLNKFVPKGFQ